MYTKIIRYFFLFSLVTSMPLLYTVAPNTVVATINAGINPAGIAITADSNFAYVANSNEYGITVDSTTTNTWYTVSVLDLTNNTLQQNIFDLSFSQPYRMAINPAGTKIYVTNSSGYTVSIIDRATNVVTGTINGFDGPTDIVILPNGLTAYVNNYGTTPGVGSGNGYTISVVDLSTNIITDTITLNDSPAAAPAALALSPNGAFLYVVNYVDGNTGTGTVNVIRTSDNSIIATINGFSGPFSIAVTPDGNYAYVTNFGSNNFNPIGTTVSVIDLSNNTISATINLDIQPAGIAITSDGRFAYATNSNGLYAGSGYTDLTPGQGTVNIIDIATNTVIPPTIAVGQSPDVIVIAPDGEFAYVSNYIYNSVDVIALQTFQITVQGCKIQNRYLTQTDIVNKLTWSVTGTSLPVSYAIYRDAGLTDLAGTVLATEPFVFLDHNRKANKTYTYYIVGTNAVGTSSVPVAVTVTQTC